MTSEKLRLAIAAIDRANAEDPNLENCGGVEVPKELLYSQRMSVWLEKLDPAPTEARQLAARAQHIRRWKVAREDYPAGREGYLRWRTFLYSFHAEQADSILRELDYDEATIGLVKKMIGKQGIKKDADVQLIEDLACLVFLEFYFPSFAEKYPEDKMIEIVRKTWRKMSEFGHQAALTIPLAEPLKALVLKALSADLQPGGQHG